MAVSTSAASAAAAAAAAAARAAQIARQKAAAEAAKRAAAAAAAKAAATAAQKAQQVEAKKKPERTTFSRTKFVDLRPFPLAGPSAKPVRERPTKNRSAFVANGSSGPKTPNDIAKINEAAEKSPEAGAEALAQRLEKTKDAQEREKVLTQSYSAIDRISSGLRQPGVTQDETNKTIASLGKASSLVSKDSAVALSARVAQGGGPFSTPNFADAAAADTRLNTALKASASKPGIATLAGNLADNYRVSGSYEKADAISALSSKFKTTAAQNPGETQAREAVEVGTVADERAKIEAQSESTRVETKRKAEELIAMTAGKLPKNVSVEATETGAIVTKTDDAGKVIGRSTASIEGDAVSLQEESYVKGQVQVSRVETTSTSISTTRATMTSDAIVNPQPIDVNALKEARDPGVSLSQQTVTTDGDKLVRTDLALEKGGASQSETTYSQHDSDAGLDDKLKGKFGDGPIDFEETKTYTIPPPGTKDAKATYGRTQVFSQEGARATSTTGFELGDRKGTEAANVADLGELEKLNEALGAVFDDDKGGEGFDGNQEQPKQWKLEVSGGNTYRAQTFVEGNPDATTVLTRTANGNEVNEQVSGKWFNKDGELADLSGQSTRAWSSSGQLTRLDNHVVDPDGTVSDQRYSLTKTKDAQGNVELQTRSTGSTTPAEGPAQSATTLQVERVTANGNVLVSARQEVSGPGGVAVTTVTPNGKTLTVNGQSVKSLAQLEALGGDRAHLGATAEDGLNSQLQTYAARRGIDISNTGDKAAEIARDGGWARAGLNLLQKPLTGVDSLNPSVTFATQQKLTAFKFSSNALGATTSLVSIAGSAANLVDSIRGGDAAAIAKSGLTTAGASAGLVGSVAEASAAVRFGGGATSTVAGIAGKFSVGLGVATGGVQVYQGIAAGDGYEIAKGGVAVGGAVGGFLLGGAAAGAWGGPAGLAVGALVGAAAFGVTQLIDGIADKEHKIADVEI